MMIQFLQIRPYSLESNQGKKIEVPAARAFVKASTQHTGGAFNLLEITAAAGFATPLHIHYSEDVALLVLEGSLTVHWGDEKRQAGPGAYFFQPRGLPHGFCVGGDAPARLLYITAPAGFDGFVDEISLNPDDVECMAIAARHQIEVLGPLPD
jgi:quercetin dioxygenase-like cupin family protein